MPTPRLQIDLKKIEANTRALSEQLGGKGVGVTGVTKAVLGDPDIARVMLAAGARSIGDSRIENIRRMRSAGVQTEFVLLRTPQLSRAAEVVRDADVSLNTELAVIKELSDAATSQGKIHAIILMVELGDLREGIMPEDMDEIVQETLGLSGIRLMGIGANLACLGGVTPNAEKMTALSDLALSLETKFGIKFTVVSGGNSANINWLSDSSDAAGIDNLRLGESILLGRETVNRSPIPGLYTDAFVLTVEVIESKAKDSVPSGELSQNAFGGKPRFPERGKLHHAVLAIGRQDVLVSGLTPLRKDLEIFGSSSDHLVLVCAENPIRIGGEVSFHLDYGALLAAMTSPYVEKVYIGKA